MKSAESGKELVQYIEKGHPEESRKVRGFVKQLVSIGNSNCLSLSLAAMVHYVLGKNGRLTQAQIKQHAQALGWDISPGDIEGAVHVLDKLGFVKAD